MMKYLIIGAGGTGGCIGGYLAKGGRNVTLLARGVHLAAIHSSGLTVRSARLGNFTVHPAACCEADYRDTPDVIFVCVKSYSLPALLPFLQRVSTKDTVIIPLLNVFGTGGDLQPNLAGTVTDGCMYIYSMLERPGVIAQPTDIFRVFFGYRKTQAHTADKKLWQVARDLKDCGIDACLSAHIEEEALTKFSFVSPLGAAEYFYRAANGDFVKPGEKQDFLLALMGEVRALGQAMGTPLPEDILFRNLRLLQDMEPQGTTSMLRDMETGRPSEFDGLIARVARLGRRYGIATPCYDKVIETYNRGTANR